MQKSTKELEKTERKPKHTEDQNIEETISEKEQTITEQKPEVIVRPARIKNILEDQPIGSIDGNQTLRAKHGPIQLWQGKVGWGVQIIVKNRYVTLLPCRATEDIAQTFFKLKSDEYDKHAQEETSRNNQGVLTANSKSTEKEA